MRAENELLSTLLKEGGYQIKRKIGSGIGSLGAL
jgi:hypothetical protein